MVLVYWCAVLYKSYEQRYHSLNQYSLKKMCFHQVIIDYSSLFCCMIIGHFCHNLPKKQKSNILLSWLCTYVHIYVMLAKYLIINRVVFWKFPETINWIYTHLIYFWSPFKTHCLMNIANTKITTSSVTITDNI